ncbi:Scr1 family TA system antitoxin-like transcriptional regulator [Streptomyces sp. NPDC052040]|uniref:Scr1 family TA system antitoxin-like transcriptional regulator n=1 Tax=Streptomyces sp. NPDC052040 TaxID=3365682 RepID=UPI0037D267A6
MTSLPVGQTYEYAACLLGNVARVHGAPDDVEDAAAVRVERSRIIRAGGHRIAFLLEESVLRHVVGEPAVMAGQLGHLLSVMALPAVSIGVIPAGRQRPMCRRWCPRTDVCRSVSPRRAATGGP